MDELPPDARAFLARAKAVHDPHDPEARARIERRLGAALALGSTGVGVHPRPSPSAGTPIFSSWIASNKAALAGVVLIFTAGGAWLSVRNEASQTAAPVEAAAAPTVEVPPGAPQVSALAAPASEARASAREQDDHERSAAEVGAAREATRSTPHRLARTDAPARAQRSSAIATRSPSPSSLAEEAALLARASDQLMQRNAQSAAKLLDEHARRYPDSQLHEEREGFVVMARCLRGSSEAPAEARAFVAKNPASVLIPRLSHLCAL